MAKTDYSQDIRSLEISVPLYSIKSEDLSPGDLQILNKAYSIYENYCENLLGYSLDPNIEDVYSFQKYVKPSEIGDLISKLTDLNNQKEEEKYETIKEQDASIPPELESLVAEYEQNKALLNSEEIQSNSQKSVAEQVKIAVAYKNRNDLILANKQRRQENGEIFRNPDEAFVTLGSPKSISKTAALAASYKAVQEVAFANESFSNLTPETQNIIIDEAVNLNLRCVTNIDVAVQSAAILVNGSNIPTEDQQGIVNVSSNYIHSVYDAINTQTQQAATYQSQIDENEVVLLQLETEAQNLTGEELEEKNIQIKSLTYRNQQLTNKIDNLPGQFEVFNNNQASDFQKFEKESQLRLSKNPDTKDIIENANNQVASIQNNLENNGVTPHLISPLDDAHLLEQAFRHDIPGVLNPHAGYEAEYAAALVDNPKTQDPDLSPQSILLSGKGLTPKLLAKAREFAIKNPDSSLGKLYKTRKDIFNAVGVQIRKISNSPLGKEIYAAKTGLGKFISSSSKLFGKIFDKVPGGFGGVLRIVQDPVGAFRSWAGKKIGTYAVNKILASTAGKATLVAGKKLAGELLKKGIGKALASIATKLGIKLGLAATGVGAPVALALLILDIVGAVFNTIKSFVQKIAKSIYGEEIKARDLLAIPAAGAVATVGGITAVVVTLSTATYIAAKSAVGTVVLGSFIGIFFYITSIVMAPLISTLVQLETQPKAIINCANMLWPFEGSYPITQGPNQTSNNCTHQGGIAQSADFATPIGTPIISMSDGIVSYAGGDSGTGYGNHVIVDATSDSGESFQIVYGHFSSVKVSSGENVKAGQTIGLSGNTGYSTGPHLHVGYYGIEYNSCPAGGFIINENCCDTSTCNQP